MNNKILDQYRRKIADALVPFYDKVQRGEIEEEIPGYEDLSILDSNQIRLILNSMSESQLDLINLSGMVAAWSYNKGESNERD